MMMAFARAMQGRSNIFYCQTKRDCIEQLEPEGPDRALLDLDTYWPYRAASSPAAKRGRTSRHLTQCGAAHV